MGQRTATPMCEPRYMDVYFEASDDDKDLRAKGGVEQGYTAKSYVQVFSDRVEFAPNLSILDLIFCEGPAALSYL